MPLSFAVDRNHRQVMLHSSYTTAAIVGGVLVSVVLLAFIFGRHSSNGSPVSPGHSLEAVRISTPRNDVLNVVPVSPAKSNDARDLGPPAHLTDNGTPPSFNESHLPKPDVVVDSNRINGLNYAILQSYTDGQIADASKKFLCDHGIPCTVEHNLHLSGFPQSEFTLVGITGFPRITSTECKAYLSKIDNLSDQYTKMTKGQKSYRAFEHVLKKWDKQG